jgi:hypothetical protein
MDAIAINDDGCFTYFKMNRGMLMPIKALDSDIRLAHVCSGGNIGDIDAKVDDIDEMILDINDAISYVKTS